MVSALFLPFCLLTLPILIQSQSTYASSYDNPAAQVDPNNYLHPQSHHELMHFLKRERHLFSPRVTSIMSSLTRHHYVGERSRATGNSYSDQPLYIGFEATIGSPQMHAGCLEQLAHLCPVGGHYLDIGTGSGYMTAAIAMLTGDQGHVTAVDLIDELITYARNAITKDHPELLSRITFAVGNGHDGFPQAAPYDCIYSGAYFDHVPAALVAQLKPGGSMLIPLSRTGSLIWTVITKKSDSTIDHKRYDHIDSGVYGGIERAVHPDDMELMEFAHVDVDEFIRGPPETLGDHQPPTHTPMMEQTSS